MQATILLNDIEKRQLTVNFIREKMRTMVARRVVIDDMTDLGSEVDGRVSIARVASGDAREAERREQEMSEQLSTLRVRIMNELDSGRIEYKAFVELSRALDSGCGYEEVSRRFEQAKEASKTGIGGGVKEDQTGSGGAKTALEHKRRAVPSSDDPAVNDLQSNIATQVNWGTLTTQQADDLTSYLIAGTPVKQVEDIMGEMLCLVPVGMLLHVANHVHCTLQTASHH